MAHRRRAIFILIAVLFLGLILWWRSRAWRETVQSLAPSEEVAFSQTYGAFVRDSKNVVPRACESCHGPDDVYEAQKWKFFQRRQKLGRAKWAEAIAIEARCGSCHVVPDPATLPSRSWDEVIGNMDEIMKTRQVPRFSKDELQDLRHFYFNFSRETQPSLPPDPPVESTPVHFGQIAIGKLIAERERPWICHLKSVDLDADRRADLLVCDTLNSSVNWIHQTNGTWVEERLASAPFPDHAEAFTNRENGRMDVIVACQTKMAPTDEPVGSVVLLSNDGARHFTPRTILDQVSRVSDVEPTDLNGDGQTDFLVAQYGYITQGEIGWIEKTATGYDYHPILKRTGAIDILPADLNGDGRPDFVVLFAQEHEMVSVFINEGNGVFREKTVFKAATPSFGSSGIQLVDLDGDGDLDVLYTNGDNMDLQTMIPRAFHGVQWLENKGSLNFEWHNIRRLYGAYAAVAGDLNGDGHLDIVVASMFNDWKDAQRASLLWLENDGQQNFRAHAIATSPIHLVACALGDFEGEGRLDIAAGGMNAFPPFEEQRMGRVTLWQNRMVSADARSQLQK